MSEKPASVVAINNFDTSQREGNDTTKYDIDDNAPFHSSFNTFIVGFSESFLAKIQSYQGYKAIRQVR